MQEINRTAPILTPREQIPRGVLVAALLTVIMWGLVEARPFLIPVLISALLAFLMSPIVRALSRFKVPEWASVTISALVLILPILAAVSFAVVEIQSLVSDFPTIQASFTAWLTRLSEHSWVERLNLPLSPAALSERLSAEAGHGVTLVLAWLKTFLEAGSQLVLILIFSIVMLASRTHLRKSFERILAQVESIESARMLDEVANLIEHFLLGRIIILVVIGIASALVIRLWGVNYSFLMGSFIGLMTLVPEIGFVVAMIPIIAVAIATGHALVSTLVLVTVLFAVHMLESYLLTPKVLGQRLNINALATFLGLFAGGLMWGIAGMFLSVPILGVMRIAFSAAPTLQPWGELLAERSDRSLALRLMRKRRQVATT